MHHEYIDSLFDISITLVRTVRQWLLIATAVLMLLVDNEYMQSD
jgi:hypothetical protein